MSIFFVFSRSALHCYCFSSQITQTGLEIDSKTYLLFFCSCLVSSSMERGRLLLCQPMRVLTKKTKMWQTLTSSHLPTIWTLHARVTWTPLPRGSVCGLQWSLRTTTATMTTTTPRNPPRRGSQQPTTWKKVNLDNQALPNISTFPLTSLILHMITSPGTSAPPCQAYNLSIQLVCNPEECQHHLHHHGRWDDDLCGYPALHGDFWAGLHWWLVRDQGPSSYKPHVVKEVQADEKACPLYWQHPDTWHHWQILQSLATVQPPG